MPSVCFGGETKASAQRYFRASLPAQALARLGWRTEVAELVLCPQTVLELAKDPRLRGGTPVHDTFGNIVDIKVHDPCDIITLRLMDDFDLLDPERRPDVTVMAESIRRAREAGQVVIVDLDDDVWNIPAWSPAARAMNRYNPSLRAVQPEVLNANIAEADAVFCTTRRIANVALDQVPGCNAFVMENGIDPAMWPWPRKPVEHEPLRVGWMGSMSHHVPHLETMIEALDVLQKYDAEFVFLGWTPSYAEKADEVLSRIPGRTSYMEWVDFRNLPALLAQVDIGIIPRVDTPFNEGQSTTSGMQYAMAGVPFIAFPSEPYRTLAEEGAGFLAVGVDHWRSMLDALLVDESLRRSSRRLFRQSVADNHGPEIVGEVYDGVLRGLL